jgi:hypothetical protein
MVLLGNYLWTQRQIEAALGARAATVLPPMRLLMRLTIELPRYKVVQLRYLARRRHVGIGEIVSQAIDVWADEADEIEDAVPGFIAAWDFPFEEANDAR